jgi:MerR family transcriptional regulator, light-induced transcriptional regulator
MNSFSIKDIANLTGIKAHTLRIWEQRYQKLFQSKRKESNHRQYDNEDLKHLLRIARLYQQGLKISGIASMSEPEILEAARVIPNEEGNRYSIIVNQLIEATIDFDQDRFEKASTQAILYCGFEKAVVKVFYPFLQRIGLLWVTDNVIPAQEHFASNLLRKKFINAIDSLPRARSGINTILFTPEGEHHEIPLLYNHYLLKKFGQPCIYLGSNTGIDVLEMYNNIRPIKRLLFSLITNFTRYSADNYCQILLTHFPDTEIYFAGSQVNNLTLTHERLHPLASFTDGMDFVKSQSTGN